MLNVWTDKVSQGIRKKGRRGRFKNWRQNYQMKIKLVPEGSDKNENQPQFYPFQGSHPQETLEGHKLQT